MVGRGGAGRNKLESRLDLADHPRRRWLLLKAEMHCLPAEIWQWQAAPDAMKPPPTLPPLSWLPLLAAAAIAC